MADTVTTCYLTGYQWYVWYLNMKVLFPTNVDILTGFLQNLIGNIMTLNLIYEKIVVANEDGDEMEIYYLYGRIAYFILIFDPIELASFNGNLQKPQDLLEFSEKPEQSGY